MENSPWRALCRSGPFAFKPVFQTNIDATGLDGTLRYIDGSHKQGYGPSPSGLPAGALKAHFGKGSLGG